MGLPGGQRHAGPRRRRADEHGSTASISTSTELGVWMVALGGAAMTISLVADAVRHANDPASQRGRDPRPRGFPHALFFGGIAVAILGLLAMLSAKLYTPGQRVHRRPAAFAGRDPARRIGVDRRLRGLASSSALGSPPVEGSAAHTHADAAARPPTAHTHFRRVDDRHNGSRRATRTPTLPQSHPRPTTRRSRSTSAAFPASRPKSRRAPRTSSRSRLIRLPKWTDYQHRRAAGFMSIGDAVTGDEHFVNIASSTTVASSTLTTRSRSCTSRTCRRHEEARRGDVHARPRQDRSTTSPTSAAR